MEMKQTDDTVFPALIAGIVIGAAGALFWIGVIAILVR